MDLYVMFDYDVVSIALPLLCVLLHELFHTIAMLDAKLRPVEF